MKKKAAIVLDPKKLYSTSEVAAYIGCSIRSVQRRAESEGIGTTVGSRLVFNHTEAEQLKQTIRRGPGNPNAGEKIGNNGGGRKGSQGE